MVDGETGLCAPNKWVTKIVEKFTRIYTRTLLFLVNLSLYKKYILVNDSMWLENRTRMLSTFRATPESSFLEIGFAGLLKNTCTYVWKIEKHSCTSEILQTCREPSSANHPPQTIPLPLRTTRDIHKKSWTIHSEKKYQKLTRCIPTLVKFGFYAKD